MAHTTEALLSAGVELRLHRRNSYHDARRGHRLRVDPSLSRLYRGYVRGAVGTRGTTLLDASYTDLRSRWQLGHGAPRRTNSPSALMTGRLNDNSLDAWASRFIGKEKVSVNTEAGRSCFCTGLTLWL